MHGQEFFQKAFVYLAAAIVSVPIAKRLGFGSILGYLVAGMVLGPFGFGLIGEEGQDVMHYAEFGVVMMLFLIGLELRPTLIWRLRVPLLGLGGLQVGITAAAGMAVGLALGLPWQTALAVGMTLSLSSTAFVLQTLAEKGLAKTDAGQNALAVLLFQDVAVIPMLALLPLLALPGARAAGGAAGRGAETAAPWVAGLPGWGQTLVVLGVVAVIIAGGLYLARHLFRFIARTRLREVFTAAALFLVVGVALLTARVGLSPALGAFVAGMVLANNEYRHELESVLEPFKGLLLAVFFLAVGASIDFHLVASRPGDIAQITGLLVAGKIAILLLLGRLFRLGTDQNVLFSFALAQGGEFAFVLFSFAVQGGVVGAELANPLIASVALSLSITPLLLLVNEKLLLPRLGTREKEEREADLIEEENPVLIAGFGHFGSIVGRFLFANGIGATVLDSDSDHVETLRRLGLNVYYGDASRQDLLAAAGAGKAKVIVLAIDDHGKTMGLVRTVQKHFPHLTIMARADGRQEAYELHEAGVAHVYRETFDTSLRLGVDALRLLGHRAFRARRAALTFHRHDEKSVRELGEMRHDRGAYLTAARQWIADLEEILLAELKDPGDARDIGWDVESRRRDFGGQ